MGNALLAEYEAVLARSDLFEEGPLDLKERGAILDAFLSMCSWMRVSYLWRPNLRDESDNHLIELAVAGRAEWVITRNLRDIAYGEILFPELKVEDAGVFMKEWRSTWAR
jgi:predicted nucleic acid-binding protein